jgi:hypothetical protein
MRPANIERDNWQLRSGEESHAAHPVTFEIPARIERDNLTRGQAAKLMFEIEAQDNDGNTDITCERMWVIVAEKIEDTYIGILDSQPVSIVHGDDVYLCFGAEVPFKAEHVIDIDMPPSKYSDWQLGQKPEREWPRNAL